MKQIRVYVQGKFSFTVRVSQDTPMSLVASRLHDVMKLSPSLVARYKTGMINFVYEAN